MGVVETINDRSLVYRKSCLTVGVRWITHHASVRSCDMNFDSENHCRYNKFQHFFLNDLFSSYWHGTFSDCRKNREVTRICSYIFIICPQSFSGDQIVAIIVNIFRFRGRDINASGHHYLLSSGIIFISQDSLRLYFIGGTHPVQYNVSPVFCAKRPPSWKLIMRAPQSNLAR